MRAILVALLFLLAIPAFCVVAFLAQGGHQAANAEFHVANMKGDLAQIRRSIDHGVPVDVRDENGDTALTIAAAAGQESVLRVLLDHGADVNATNRRGWTALSYAATRGDGATVELLLNAGANVNAASHNGRTPLMRAAAAGQASVVKLLLAHGARKDLTDADGLNALALARRVQSTPCVLALNPREGERLASVGPPPHRRARPWQPFRAARGNPS